MWFYKKPRLESRYNVEKVGSLIVEKTQLPHALIEPDGTRYEIITWIIRLRVENGQIFIERRYAQGSQASLDAMRKIVNPYTDVSSESSALTLFYEELWRRYENLGR